MDKAIIDIFTWQTILFCIGVYFLTFIIRRFVDRLIAFFQAKRAARYQAKLEAFKKAQEKLNVQASLPPESKPPQPLVDLVWWWRELFLPLLPLFVGAFSALLIKSYPYPSLVATNGIRVFFGIVCGGVSAMLYKILKNILRKAGGMKQDEGTDTKEDFDLMPLTKPSEKPKEEEPTKEPKS